ncbi:MAG: hypothetical protein GY767_22610 [Shimia sp.]|nr:hypothetical protein [Shimia sp.]
MAISPRTIYPANQIDTTDPTGYPQGAAQNITTPGDGKGTPFDFRWINDLWGLMQSLLSMGDKTPTGTPDKVGASQLFDAVREIHGKWATVVFADRAALIAGTTVTGLTVSWSELAARGACVRIAEESSDYLIKTLTQQRGDTGLPTWTPTASDFYVGGGSTYVAVQKFNATEGYTEVTVTRAGGTPRANALRWTVGGGSAHFEWVEKEADGIFLGSTPGVSAITITRTGGDPFPDQILYGGIKEGSPVPHDIPAMSTPIPFIDLNDAGAFGQNQKWAMVESQGPTQLKLYNLTNGGRTGDFVGPWDVRLNTFVSFSFPAGRIGR